MRRSYVVSFFAACLSLIVGLLAAPVIELGRAILHTDYADHRSTMKLEHDARAVEAVPIVAQFKAFFARALKHDLFSACRFDLTPSTGA